jgi:hypothetical protein
MDTILDLIYSEKVQYLISPLFYACLSLLIYRVLVHSTANYKLSQFKIETLTKKDIAGLYAFNVIGVAVICLILLNEHLYKLYRILILCVPVAAYSTYKGLQERIKVIERYKQFFK